MSRNGSDTAQLLDRPGSLLHTYRRNVTLVQEPVPNEISSSRVRPRLAAAYVVPTAGCRISSPPAWLPPDRR